jgi:solute carrier family 13 (sodium-dependent dicarboxylate transporter), member 2/3/5
VSKKIGLFLAPLLFVIILLFPAPEVLGESAWKVIAIAVFMLVWWITEAVPIPVASLLPMVLLPLLGVMDIKTASAPYANPIVFLFMGGFMVALAMERWNLHRRIALNIVKLTGTNANGIILGFMLATALLSMWISNTATTVMMLPIAVSVIDLLSKNRNDNTGKGMRNFAIAMMLGIAYAANIGGTATIIGTPPNSVFAGFVNETYGYEISFAKWMILGVPFAALLIGLTYSFLVKILYPNRLGKFEGGQDLIEEEVEKLGQFSREEKLVLIIFLCTALCWIMRVPLNSLFKFMDLPIDLSDTGIALIATISLFIVPRDLKFEVFLMEWKDTARLPWGILLLFGGGLSLAGALSATGVIDLIGGQFKAAESTGFLIILGLTTVSLFLTEVMSNVALVTIFLPVVGGIAIGTGVDPIYLMIPVTLAASCAFMLPMSTPPNAIVFASGHLTVMQMVRAGIILNLLSILLIAVLAKWIIPLIFSTG